MNIESKKSGFQGIGRGCCPGPPVLGFLLLVGLAGAGQSIHAQQLSLDDIVQQVEGASETPDIDATVATLDRSCGFATPSPAGTDDSSIPLRFHAASISKLFTAIVIMQLRDEGLLSLEDRVGTHDPTFSGSSIQINHLLTHTSGLRDRRRADGRTSTDAVDAYVRSLAKQKIRKSPGTDWRYADAGFNLLGRIIEQVTGKPFSLVMKERLLAPLGMQNSDFDVSQVPEKDRASAYNKRGKLQKHPWDLAFAPSSGLQTTAADLALFAQALLKVSVGKSSYPLSTESLLEMTKERMATDWDGVKQGYGWQLVTTSQGPQWRHAGGEAGFETLLTLYPRKGFAIAVLGNREDWPRFRFEQAIRNSVLATPGLCSRNP